MYPVGELDTPSRPERGGDPLSREETMDLIYRPRGRQLSRFLPRTTLASPVAPRNLKLSPQVADHVAAVRMRAATPTRLLIVDRLYDDPGLVSLATLADSRVPVSTEPWRPRNGRRHVHVSNRGRMC